jgi:diaminopimelate decarboxylase
MPEIILEPGRSLVGNAGVLISKIITVSKKAAQTATVGFIWIRVNLTD